MTTTWAVAVFAHNEEANIAANLASIQVAVPDVAIQVVVLANGCSDHTVDVVRELAVSRDDLRLVEISLADKANAWNHYVHEVSASPPFSLAEMHVFVDGDIQLVPGSLIALAASLDEMPAINAAGGLPANGRDREAWRQRMMANGTLAGGLYALPGEFVERMRQRRIRIPQGLIGEDWLVSLFAKSDLRPLADNAWSISRIAFPVAAGFAFRSLGPWCRKDWVIYLRRLWRYALRGVQFEMLFTWLLHQPPEALPATVELMYRQALPPSRMKWIGFSSPLRFLAIQRIRSLRSEKLSNL
jgi:glycosyltransferase involved in cell wall biosynthesis